MCEFTLANVEAELLLLEVEEIRLEIERSVIELHKTNALIQDEIMNMRVENERACNYLDALVRSGNAFGHGEL